MSGQTIHTLAQGTPCHLETIAAITSKSQKHIRNLSINGHIPAMKKSIFPDGFDTIIKYINYIENGGGDDIENQMKIEKLKKIISDNKKIVEDTRKSTALATKYENNSVDLDIVEEVWNTVGLTLRNTLIASVASVLQDLNRATNDRERETILVKNFEDVLNKLSDGSVDEILNIHETTLEESNDKAEPTQEDNE